MMVGRLALEYMQLIRIQGTQRKPLKPVMQKIATLMLSLWLSTSTQLHDHGTIPNVLTKDWIVNHPKYKHLFSGIGRFECAPVSIEMKSDVEPIQKAARRVPLALKDKFSKEIQSMVDAGILTKLTPEMPAPQWLNSFVVVKKPNGNLCACLDLTDLNKSIIRPVCNKRTLEEIIDLLKGSHYFAVFDSTKSFFHVPIDEASRQLKAMLTPVDIYLYNVLAMALSNATDIFESCMRNIVAGLEGVVNIADDVLVFATKYEKFNVISFLDNCVQHDLHLNPDKIHINVNSVPFFGQTLTKHGLMMEENKRKVVHEWPIPTNIVINLTFICLINYMPFDCNKVGRKLRWSLREFDLT